MTPEQEDDLVAQFWTRADEDTISEAVRLAIRAAVAAERERCAKVCEEHEPKDYTTAGIMTRMICAAAIRRG